MVDRHPIPRKIIGGHVAHKPHGKPYAFGCTEAAIRRAARQGFDGIDLDMTINADGTPMCNHWSLLIRRDKWRDPTQPYSRDTRIDDLTDEQCARLRYRDENGVLHPMLTCHEAAIISKEVGIIPCFEAKSDRHRLFYKIAFWRQFKAEMDTLGVVPIIMSLPGSVVSRTGQRKLAAAWEAGLVTMWLWRKGHPTPPARVDLVKSHQGRPIYLAHPIIPPMPPPLPKPPSRPKYNPKKWKQLGSPVMHPFAKRSDRWKRRHRRLWNRIVAFRKKWRNR